MAVGDTLGAVVGVGVAFASGVTETSFDIPSWYPPLTTRANQYFNPALREETVIFDVNAPIATPGTSR